MKRPAVLGWWEVDVGISAEDESRDLFEVQDACTWIAETEPHSSGYGFGYRDLQYPFGTKKKARAVAGAIIEHVLWQQHDYASYSYAPPTWWFKFLDMIGR